MTMQTFYELDLLNYKILLREVDEQGVKQREWTIEPYYVREALSKGGSFYNALANAMGYADQYNLAKILKAFDNRIIKACLDVSDEYKELLD